MILLDTALRAREAQGAPIRVGMVGAGFMGQGLTNQIVNSVPGMRMVAVSNRTPERAADVFRYAGVEPVRVDDQSALEDAIRAGHPAFTDDPFLLCRSEQVDVVCEVTGDVEYATPVLLEAFRHGKDVVLMNAEIDATIGPILQVYAEQHGVILSACEGDEPGVQMNLYRWVKGLGLEPRVMGNVKGLQDPYRNPTTQKGFAEQWGQNAVDGHIVRGRVEDLVRAVDRGERDRVHCPRTGHVARSRVSRRRDGDRLAVRRRPACGRSAASSTTSSARR